MGVVRLYKEKRIEIRYPVGKYISSNIPIINAMVRKIKELYPKEGISLWCRGSSGTLISGIIASKLRTTKRRVTINYVKKEHEASHADYYTSIVPGDVHIIVDDFVSSGTTLDAIEKEMKKKNVKADCLCVSGGLTDDYFGTFSNVICSHEINWNRA